MFKAEWNLQPTCPGFDKDLTDGYAIMLQSFSRQRANDEKKVHQQGSLGQQI